MKSHRSVMLSAFVLIVTTFLRAQNVLPTTPPPPTAARTVIDTLHGVVLEDPYRWLEDQDSPETRRWIEAQNAYTESLLQQVPGREAVRARLSDLMKVDVLGTPIERNGRYFFSKRMKDQDLFIVCMRQGIDGPDEVLLDPHPLSEDHRTSIGLMSLTQDGTLLAYSVRKGGEDEVEVHLYDVDRRRDLSTVFPRARYAGFSILPDRSGIYYGLQTPDGPRLYWHRMGTAFMDDELILGEGFRSGQWIGSFLSDDGRYLAITTGEGSAPKKTELYLKNLREGGPTRVVVDDLDARFSMTFAGDDVLIQTNWDAPNGRIYRAPLADPGRDHWKDVGRRGKAVRGHAGRRPLARPTV